MFVSVERLSATIRAFSSTVRRPPALAPRNHFNALISATFIPASIPGIKHGSCPRTVSISASGRQYRSEHPHARGGRLEPFTVDGVARSHRTAASRTSGSCATKAQLRSGSAVTGVTTLNSPSSMSSPRRRAHRLRCAAPILAFPSTVFGPVESPPWKRQRRLPGTVATRQGSPCRFFAPQVGNRRAAAT
jgi:hypothetical protein